MIDKITNLVQTEKLTLGRITTAAANLPNQEAAQDIARLVADAQLAMTEIEKIVNKQLATN
jgi:hypothetical protein